ncbi:MAG TPA: hypothetical protein VHI13_09000 [Candidatus Kapabacteria bacterium]|nr:hypothetical protein [Candidatus Kapabacteria bacterium]
MSVPRSTQVVVDSYRPACPPDGGRSWTYVHGADKIGTREHSKTLLPRLPKWLRLPVPWKPVVTPE